MTQRMLSQSADTLVVLLEDYKQNKSELSKINDKLQNQSITINFVGSIIAASLSYTFLTKQPAIDLTLLPFSLKIAVLLAFVSFLFYTVAMISNTSLHFRLLRLKVIDIEKRMAADFSYDRFGFESFTDNKLNGWIDSKGRFTLHFWTGVWRIVLFLAIIFILLGISYKLEPSWYMHIVMFSIIYFSIKSIEKYINIYLPTNINQHFINAEYVHDNRVLRFNILRSIFQYLFFGMLYAVMILSYLYSDQIGVYFKSAVGSTENFTPLILNIVIGIYSALCAVAMPLPSEAPIVFLRADNWIGIFLAAMLGKGIGSAVLCNLSGTFIEGVNYVYSKLGPQNTASGLWLAWVKSRIDGRHSDLTYFVFQSIPFFPMRTATIAYGAIFGRGLWPSLKVGFFSFVGTAFRMALMLLLFKLSFTVIIAPW